MMKTSLAAALVMSLVATTHCAAQNRCRIFRSSKCCPQPARTVCNSSSAVSVDQPSELNILLTTELVQLRKQLEEMKLAAAERDKALEEANQLVSTQKAEADQKLEEFAKQTRRTRKVEEELKAAKAELAETKNALQVAKDNEKKEAEKAATALAGMRKENQKLKKQVKQLQDQLAKEKKEREEERRKHKENATPPTRDEEAANEKTPADAGGEGDDDSPAEEAKDAPAEEAKDAPAEEAKDAPAEEDEADGGEAKQ